MALSIVAASCSLMSEPRSDDEEDDEEPGVAEGARSLKVPVVDAGAWGVTVVVEAGDTIVSVPADSAAALVAPLRASSTDLILPGWASDCG